MKRNLGYAVWVYPGKTPENKVELIYDNGKQIKTLGTYKTVMQALKAIDKGPHSTT